MRSPVPRSLATDPHSAPAASAASGGGGGGARDAELLFRAKKIPEIRAVETATRSEIEAKEEELRQLVGRSYRDLIDSADSILLIKTSCEAISSNLAEVDAALASLSAADGGDEQREARLAPDPARARLYGAASRVKYLVDTPENIWGCLDESMLLEASGRYLRAREVHSLLATRRGSDLDILARFPLLRHQWQIVEGFKSQISQRTLERLLDPGLTVTSYADALAAATTIDDLDPKQVLQLFLDTRRSWISQKLAGNPSDPDSCFSALCDVVKTIRVSLGQVGELFLLASNEMPLLYKVVLGSPPGTQLFGAIPNPEEEVKLWKLHRESLEVAMVLLEPEFVAHACSAWLEGCCSEIFGELSSGRKLIDAIVSGEGLGSAEKLVREVLESREGLEESLEQWLRSGFGSDIESPWNQICGLVLKEGKDILEDRLEEAFVCRMKKIMHSEFENLSSIINVRNSIEAITPDKDPKGRNDFQAYLKKASTGGVVWFSESKQKKAGILANLKSVNDENDFQDCLNLYFGPEVSHIRDALDGKCRSILEDLLSFVEANNSTSRLKELVPFVQEECYRTISFILNELEVELGKLSASLGTYKEDGDVLVPSVIVERSLFVGRLLFALRYHSSHIPMILGSPRRWVKETGSAALANLSSPLPRQSRRTSDSPVSFTPRRHTFDNSRSPHLQFVDSPKRQTVAAAAALFGADDTSHLRLGELNRALQKLCIRAYNLWITWVSSELSLVLSEALNKDDALSSSTPPQGWDVTVIKQEESSEGPLEIQIVLPSMPSIYIISFLYQACLEVHSVGGHILEKTILQNFVRELLEKVIGIYENLLIMMEAGKSRVSEKGILQILLDLHFIADILSGCPSPASSISDHITKQETTQSMVPKLPFRWKQPQIQPDSASRIGPVMKLIDKLSERLDPIDWATYQPYLRQNEIQSYKRHAVLFGFFVQLKCMYTDTVQKLPTKSNTDSNIVRCSQVPRFKYLPISAPTLTSRGAQKLSLPLAADDSLSRSPWKSYSNGERSNKAEFDNQNFGVATPLLKSFMTQVGSKFGESTSRWGSMLSDGQVGKLKDRSTAAMSTFGDILPGPAAGLLSSLTAGARFDS